MTVRATAKHGTGFWCDEHQRFISPLKMNYGGDTGIDIVCPICFFESGETWVQAKLIKERTVFKCPRPNCDITRDTQDGIDDHIKYYHAQYTSVMCRERTCTLNSGSNWCQKCNSKFCDKHMEIPGDYGVCKECAKHWADTGERGMDDFRMY